MMGAPATKRAIITVVNAGVQVTFLDGSFVIRPEDYHFQMVAKPEPDGSARS